MLLVLLESLNWVRFNEGDLEILKPKVQKILNFESFFSLEIELNYKNGFGRKI
jgi:hypothetical protein